MSAMAGAGGLRAWLQTRGWSFMTPERLRRVTIGAFVVATLVSTIGLSGSTKPAHARTPAPAAYRSADSGSPGAWTTTSSSSATSPTSTP